MSSFSSPSPSPVPSTTTPTWAYFDTIAEAGADWDAAAPRENIFLQRPYLQILEDFPPLGMRFGYLVFYVGDQPAGVAYCQIKRFKGDDNINETEHNPENPCFFNVLGKWIKRWVAGKVSSEILICGNMLLTGEHGMYFNPKLFTVETFAPVLEKALDATISLLEKRGQKLPVILIKDILPAQVGLDRFFTTHDFFRFEIQPNMIFSHSFANFEDYLGHMSKKYRTRTKRAFKKGTQLERKELDLMEIKSELPKIYHLYREIATNSGFNMVDLNEQYLPTLKERLGDDFQLFAYYLEGKLVAFFSIIHNVNDMEAHFLGYEKSLNHDHQIYLNILYDIAKTGISAGKKEIIFARTALEIKSSIGATAEPLYCYLRHQNNLANKFTGTLLEYLKPIENWTPRHPFKHGADDEEDI